jgi:hypothetical protein
MADRRVTSAITGVEYRDKAERRATSVVTGVEYRDKAERRVTAAVVMVEYSFPPPPDAERFGPEVQII